MLNDSNTVFLEVKDHSVSGEVFTLYHNEDLDLLMTTPQPPANELSRYYESDDYISHTDGKRSLIEKLYQAVKNIALKRKLKLINKLCLTRGSLLDIGAGTGDFLATANRDGWNVLGVEPSEKAKTIALSKGVSFGDNLESFSDYSFDVITMWHVLEHVPNLEEQIAQLKRLLKPTGTILIAVPNFKSYDAQLYKNFWAAYDVPRHLWHFSKTSISKLFGQQDFVLNQILPMPFDAYYVSLLSEKYKTGKMNFLTAFWNGFTSNYKAASSKEYSSHIYVIKNS